MKKVIATAAAVACAASANAIILDISTIADSGIHFDGSGSFSFFSSGFSMANFQIDDSDGAAGDSQFLLGQIEGTWTIDDTSGNVSTVSGGTGTFRIWDAADNVFTADIDFKRIGVVLNGGIINGAMNLTNFMYSGLNDDLNELLADGLGEISLSFEIGSGPTDLTLAYLSANEARSTFSGDVESSANPPRVPDGGVTAAMLGLGLLAIGGVSSRHRAVRSRTS